MPDFMGLLPDSKNYDDAQSDNEKLRNRIKPGSVKIQRRRRCEAVVGVVWYPLEPTANKAGMVSLNFPCGKINGKIRLTHWVRSNFVVISLNFNISTLFAIYFFTNSGEI
jgi:hypothetical protein